MESFRDVISLWKTPDLLAIEIGANIETARKWKQRNSIPAYWWPEIVRAARKHGKYVSIEMLAEMAAAEREATP